MSFTAPGGSIEAKRQAMTLFVKEVAPALKDV
jgi:hypothetical protein